MAIELSWIEDTERGGVGLRIGYAPGSGIQLHSDEVDHLRRFLTQEGQ